MQYQMRGITLRNTHYADKPNEDLLFYDEANSFAMVLDGVTRDRENGVYPNPSPSRAAAEAFAAAAQESMRETAASALPPIERLSLAAQRGNAAVAARNAGFSGAFLPGTVGVLALIEGGALHYAYVGDSNGGVLGKDGLCVFTEPQTAEVHRRRSEFTSDEIRTVICNNAAHPCGYGVWNGQPEAMAFLRTGMIPLKEGERVLLCTDGFDAFLSSMAPAALAKLTDEEMLAAASAFVLTERWMDDRTMLLASAGA